MQLGLFAKARKIFCGDQAFDLRADLFGSCARALRMAALFIQAFFNACLISSVKMVLERPDASPETFRIIVFSGPCSTFACWRSDGSRRDAWRRLLTGR